MVALLFGFALIPLGVLIVVFSPKVGRASYTGAPKGMPGSTPRQSGRYWSVEMIGIFFVAMGFLLLATAAWGNSG